MTQPKPFSKESQDWSAEYRQRFRKMLSTYTKEELVEVVLLMNTLCGGYSNAVGMIHSVAIAADVMRLPEFKGNPLIKKHMDACNELMEGFEKELKEKLETERNIN